MGTSGHKLKLLSAVSIVISSMIGTGVFTSLGLQVSELPSVFSILILWTVGGIVAICGALNYGELAVAFPRSGGEYNYLSILIHPMVGFLSAFVSAIAGFAAPAALSSIAFSYYFHAATGIDSTILVASSLLIGLTLLHSFNLRLSSILQNISTGINVSLIIFFVVAGFIHGPHQHFVITVNDHDLKMLLSRPFAVSLIYVYFAYVGWNSAIYIAGEISNPKKNLSLSLVIATLLVMVLYIFLIFIFLYVTPLAALKGQIDIGFISAHAIFGLNGGKIISMIICVALLASVSSYLFFGPRVLHVLGEDYEIFKRFTKVNSNGIPLIALFFQSGIAFLLILTSSFDAILSITSIVLSLFTTFTVVSVFVLRGNEEKYKLTWKAIGFPFTAILFLLVEGWMIFFTLIDKTKDSLMGFAFLGIGVVFYFIMKKYNRNNIKFNNH